MSDTTPIEHPSWLTTGDFTAADEPLRLFAAWLTDATASEPRDPTAMTLATVDADGVPNARMVLLKGADERGFAFYTNMDSQKGQELGGHPQAALVFIEILELAGGCARLRERVTDAEADAYFASRPKQAQIGAWASQQSAPLESRLAFEKAVATYAAKYAIGTVPRPPNWSGYRIVPLSIEFWQERPFRLHDRIAFTRSQPDAAWSKTRLYP
jgi:pyridoxamine 5'-phosphate oxidase